MRRVFQCIKRFVFVVFVCQQNNALATAKAEQIPLKMLPPKWQENRNLKVRLIFRWITFLEKQHSNYFWLVLTAGGICSNFINTNQNSLPNSLAHTRKTWHGANVTDQTLKWAKESNSTWDDWWIFGLIWSFFSGLSKLHILGQRNGVGGGWRQYVRDRTLKGRRKKIKSKEVSRGD